MSGPGEEPQGPDFTQGLPLAEIADGGLVAGHVGEEAVLLARRGEELFAVGAHCTHYGAPLADGLLVGDTVRCPWHHACFSLRSGAPLRAPALDPLARYRVEQRDGRIFVGDREPAGEPPAPAPPSGGAGEIRSVVIVGGGAAGNAAAEELRRQGYGGAITMLSADESVPCDRPNLSKAYLAGTAPEEYALLRTPDFYAEHRIDLRLGTRVEGIDPAAKEVELAGGGRLAYDALLLATGAEPVRLDLPGADLPHVRYLRTFADSREIVARAQDAHRAVVIGASFIGLEVAASLRHRGVEVDVVAPDEVPMERVLGREAGEFVRGLHERHGVTFRLGTTAAAIGERSVTLATGEVLEADLVVIGVGVRPALGIAEKAGCLLDKGVVVDGELRTSVPAVFAAGDIARWPDPRTGQAIRVEHWVVAERQGQTAARNILGRGETFDAVPFFWSEHYDVTFNYVGHAEVWDEIALDGELSAERQEATLTYRREGKTLAVVTVRRDLESLRAEVELEGGAG
jgi:NADPH-dependent 2,4-dienoyl-CoA reductase/sulfur reductase-like enzyme/nitrite reductase/ring-hydroxylating ferredoxin subunit